MGGSWCCIPQCRSGTSKGFKLYKVPYGKKRFGLPTDEWSNQFHQVIFRYKFNLQFKRKVKNGKVFICEKHFEDDDIQRSISRSWIKLGRLPTLNLPTKSPVKHEKLTQQESSDSHKCSIFSNRRVKDVITDESWGYSSLRDITNDFQKLNTDNWRFHNLNNMLHLTFYENPYQHAIAKVSLLITQTENEILFNVALNGTYCMDLSNQLSEKKMDLAGMLTYLQKLQNCGGYENVEDKSSWLCTMVMDPYSNPIRRFVSYSCLKFLEVTDDDKGELFTCTNCKKHHSKLKAKLNLKETNLLNLTEIPFSQHVPISRLSQKRVITTVQVHHKKCHIRSMSEICGPNVTSKTNILLQLRHTRLSKPRVKAEITEDICEALQQFKDNRY